MLEEALEDEDEEVKVTAKADEKEVLAIVQKHFSEFMGGINKKVTS